jgi:hypothetical protein
MKKLSFFLALLSLILMTQGAFANQYPSCYQGYGSSDPLYNGTNGDAFDSKGWCIDGYGVKTPKNTVVNTSNPNSQGGVAVPVQLVQNAPSLQSTYDSILPQQTGTYIVDTGGFMTSGTPLFANSIVTNLATIDTLVGRGGHYVLPMAMPGEMVTISSASKSVITVDTMTPSLATAFGLTSNTGAAFTASDTIEWSPGGTAMTAGQNIQSPGFAGDTVTLVSPAQGLWMITAMQGSTSNTATSDTLWKVVSTQ